jgi:hypothetical protein
MLNYMEEFETITWTQVMTVENGNSKTWGQFGGESLKMEVPTK